MTSTNITIGHQGEPRNSSRVLKPPGGGHSDIFGIHEDNSMKAPPARKNIPKSSIQEVFMGDTDKTDNKKIETQVIEKVENGEKENVEKDNVEKENGEKENGEKENGEKENGEQKQNGKEEAPKPQIPVTPQRVRVPPGGFSSGLW